jgi:hypothetical protein
VCSFDVARYLEAIEAIVKSQTKGSPYYNIVFLERLKEMSERMAGGSLLAAAGYVIAMFVLSKKVTMTIRDEEHICS